jgi:hypothetical protein
MDDKMKIDKETDITYQVYLQYITFLLEDSGDMAELPQIKQLASRLTLAKEINTLNRNISLEE